MLDLERCPFIRPLEASGPSLIRPAADLRCWAVAEPRQIPPDEQQRRCFTTDHTRCPTLSSALALRPGGPWSELGTVARVVAESCHLAEAQLEVRSERIGSLLDRVFRNSP